MRILAWCDSPLAPTGFGESSRHVLFALHEAGHTITQLAVNADTSTLQEIPWKTFTPMDRANDPYGLRDFDAVLAGGRYDAFWSTFDPETPWFYQMPGGQTVIDRIAALRLSNPGFKMSGWFPVDGGPLSDPELAVLGMAPLFDAPVTMSPHVYELIEWTMKLRGRPFDPAQIRQRLRLIPHGVDLTSTAIPTDEQRREEKRKHGFSPDSFVILQIERNQQRKQNYLAMEVMEQLFKRTPALRGKVILYQHMAPNEDDQGCRVGWNLPELSWRYGLQPGRDIIWAPGFVPKEAMLGVYQCADAFLSVSTGEGFQYPAWQALACGVPIVVPNDSARAAYFAHAPNAHLYATDEQRIVLRGGYNRRMNFARPEAAASVLRKMIEGKKALAPQREGGRAWVARTADMKDVQRQWVELYAGLEAQLNAERATSKLAPLGNAPFSGAVVGWKASPSIGDALLAGPALRVLRAKMGVRVHVPRPMLEVAAIADFATELSTEPLPAGAPDFSTLAALPDWVQRPRAEVFAAALGIEPGELRAYRTAARPAAVEAGKAQFLDQFGVTLQDCIGLCFETDTPHRSLPPNYYERLVGAVRTAGFTPLILGKTQLNYRKVGVADLTGATDVPTLVTIVGQLRAFVGADSGPLHAALAQGVPSVGCFTIVDPKARLGYYEARWSAVVPNDPAFPVGEQIALERASWAPYPQTGEWSIKIKVSDICAALRELLESTNA